MSHWDKPVEKEHKQGIKEVCSELDTITHPKLKKGFHINSSLVNVSSYLINDSIQILLGQYMNGNDEDSIILTKDDEKVIIHNTTGSGYSTIDDIINEIRSFINDVRGK